LSCAGLGRGNGTNIVFISFVSCELSTKRKQQKSDFNRLRDTISSHGLTDVSCNVYHANSVKRVLRILQEQSECWNTVFDNGETYESRSRPNGDRLVSALFLHAGHVGNSVVETTHDVCILRVCRTLAIAADSMDPGRRSCAFERRTLKNDEYARVKTNVRRTRRLSVTTGARIGTYRPVEIDWKFQNNVPNELSYITKPRGAPTPILPLIYNLISNRIFSFFFSLYGFLSKNSVLRHFI